MKKLKMLLLTCFMVMTNAAMAQDHLNLPYFISGPIQYGMVSETALTYQGEATVQRCMEPNLKHVKIPYNVSRGLTNWTSVTFDFRKGMQNFCVAATATSPYKDWSTINRVWAPQIF